jgi:phospholipid/cholesterol/gamma-HCH transport system permease protein
LFASLLRWISGTGDQVFILWRQIFAMVGLFYDTLWAALRPGSAASGGRRSPLVKQVVGQILFTGVEAFWLIGVIGLITGVTIIIQAMTNMPKLGVGEYFGKILVMAVVRELSPFFTGLIVVARSGSALAAYIGTMKISREITALEVMGIDPIHYIVLPAFWGIVIAMLCLNIYFDVIAIFGGLLVAHIMGVTANIPFGIFAEQVMNAFGPWDIPIALFKTGIFGIIIAVVSSYYGLAVTSVRAVPQAALRSVVTSMATTIVVNMIVTIFAWAYLYA